MGDHLITSSGGGGGGGGGGALLRDYRKGNWTLQETMILIEAKKMDDERRMKKQQQHLSLLSGGGASASGSGSGSGGEMNKPIIVTELRWKWVEDYCWRNGCFRSQNQCNDKWDNLMRDYKRVRDYEKTRLLLLASSNNSNDEGCYWKIEKSERKGKNLPSNMLHQIYEALVEVVERKLSSASVSVPAVAAAAAASSQQQQQQEEEEEEEEEERVVVGYVNVVAQPINQIQPPPPTATAAPILPITATKRTRGDRSSSETSASEGTTAKKTKRRREEEAFEDGLRKIAEAIEAFGERSEARHKEEMRMQERRLESNHALVNAIHSLAQAFLHPPPPH